MIFFENVAKQQKYLNRGFCCILIIRTAIAVLFCYDFVMLLEIFMMVCMLKYVSFLIW